MAAATKQAMSLSETDPQLARTRFNLETAAILLLDADAMSLSILSQVLSGFGAHNLVKCESMIEVKTALSKTEFQLIILDPAPFGEEGYDFIPWLRRHEKAPNRFTSVIIASGHTQASRVSSARDSGANFVVTKPLAPITLFERIMWMAREQRPFVECKAYAGPERRFRHEGPPPGMDGRRAEDIAAMNRFSSDQTLDQTDIDSIMQPQKVAR